LENTKTFCGKMICRVRHVDEGHIRVEVPVSSSTKEDLISAIKDISDEVMQKGLKTEHENGFTFYPPHTIMSISAEY